MRIKEKNLRELIIFCTYNIKGLIKDVEIRQLLPINSNGVKVYEDYNKLIVEYQNKIIGEILMENHTYSNLRILSLITPIYGINFKGTGILELMKYRNNIITILI